MKNTDGVPAQRNGCEDGTCAPETGFLNSATNDRECGGQVDTSGPLDAKNSHSTVKPIPPAESSTDTNVLVLYKQAAVGQGVKS